MTEELETLLLVTRLLDEAGIAYMLGGAMALGLYSQPRMTRDIDIVVDLESGDVRRIRSIFADDWYVDEGAIAEAISARRMFNAIYLKFMLKVDLIVNKATPFDRSAFGRRRAFTLNGQAISVTTVEDLIVSKLRWGNDSKSEKQATDIAVLLRTHDEIDWKYLNRWVGELGLDDYFKHIRNP